jgi:hypothetical protein
MRYVFIEKSIKTLAFSQNFNHNTPHNAIRFPLPKSITDGGKNVALRVSGEFLHYV